MKYTVELPGIIWRCYEVEANDPIEAIEIAGESLDSDVDYGDSCNSKTLSVSAQAFVATEEEPDVNLLTTQGKHNDV